MKAEELTVFLCRMGSFGKVNFQLEIKERKQMKIVGYSKGKRDETSTSHFFLLTAFRTRTMNSDFSKICSSIEASMMICRDYFAFESVVNQTFISSSYSVKLIILGMKRQSSFFIYTFL